ncbi:MAG: ABC transporter permease [Gemmatimonadaceae bacterium]|nr:ABC transporter permease [Gemmatimonadaceae bacterium]
MRSALALLRAAWLGAISYRVATLLSFVAVLASIVPVFFIAGAVQDLAADSIRLESASYFGFVVVGMAGMYLASAAVGALPGAIAGGIGSGTFESLLGTRASLPSLLVGFAAYPVLQALLRSLVLLAGAALLGVSLAWPMLLPVLGIVLLLIAAYAGIGLVASALLLLFRTSGPIVPAAVALSGLLGGAYYATSVVPGWLQSLTGFVPLGYALRASRMLLLGDAAVADVAADVMTLSLFAVTSLAIGALCFGLALRQSRRSGSLSQY